MSPPFFGVPVEQDQMLINLCIVIDGCKRRLAPAVWNNLPVRIVVPYHTLARSQIMAYHLMIQLNPASSSTHDMLIIMLAK